MPEKRPPRKWLFFLPLLIGVTVLVAVMRQQSPPVQAEAAPPARAVRVIEAPLVDVVPRAVGYGRVRPARTWDGVAQVGGRVVELHPRLRRGALLGEGERLLRIDPTDYELAVAQVRAELASARARLAEMSVRESNIRASLEIEQEALELRAAEVARKRELAAQGTLSASELEQEQRNLLAQRQQVQAQQNALALLPAERELLEAELERLEARLEAAQLDLARTELHLPFAARIAAVNVEKAQYVREGSLLVEADGVDTAEVQAEIPVSRMRALMRPGQTLDLARIAGEGLAGQLGIEAEVWLRDPGGDVRWEARFVRISDALDPETRTVGVIVEVPRPYGDVRPGERPPLVKGLFVEVVLRGPPRPQRLVIPRLALHPSGVYVIEDGRLAIRPVTVAARQPEYVVIEAGLSPGARVVVSDLSPAIEGMPLTGEPDPDALARLIEAARGRG